MEIYNNSTMKKISETIVFFGSGPVAARSLELLTHNFSIEAVVTKPRPAHHKGEVPVLRVAEQFKLPIITAANKKDLSKTVSTQTFASRLAVLIDFGIIVEQTVIDTFPLGIVNSHFSLLPEWRGADPITFSILSGQQQTGVSLMLLVERMDEGPLLAQTPVELTEKVTGPELTTELIAASDESLCRMLPLYLSCTARPAPQEKVTIATSNTPTYSRKLTKQDSQLNWQKPAVQLEREVRAFAAWPKSRAVFSGKDIIVTQARVEDSQGKPGTIWRDGKRFGYYTAKDILEIQKLKPAGKPEMTAEAFLAGYASKLTQK